MGGGAGGFRKGDRVEVSSKENGFVGSWYEGVVIRKAAKSCTVRYRTLVGGERSDEALEESVELGMLRPVPPPIEAPASFGYGDPVEVYDRDGWWVGIVSRVLEEGEQYMVYFRESVEESLYPRSQLRVRQDWLNGVWVRVFQKPNRDLEELRRGSPAPRKRKQIRGFGGLKRRLISDRDNHSDRENPDEGGDEEEREDDEPNNININTDNLQLSLGVESSPQHSDDSDHHPHNTKLPSKSPSDGVVEPSPRSFSGGNNNRSKRKQRDPEDGDGDEQQCSSSKCKLREIQLRAYSGVLKAFRSKGGGLTWHQEQLISDLRSQFDIDNEFHIQQLEALDGFEPSCDCSYCSCS